jgi:uncharacterized protein (TIGR03067 family)
MKLKIDPTKKPKTIDLSSPQGQAMRLSQGIYLLEGDDLKICQSRAGARPTEFKTGAGNATTLMILKRIKP